MPVQRSRQELGHDINALHPRIDAIGYWHVDQAVFPPQGNSRLAALLGQGIQASAGATPQNHTEDIAREKRCRKDGVGCHKIPLINNCQIADTMLQ